MRGRGTLAQLVPLRGRKVHHVFPHMYLHSVPVTWVVSCLLIVSMTPYKYCPSWPASDERVAQALLVCRLHVSGPLCELANAQVLELESALQAAESRAADAAAAAQAAADASAAEAAQLKVGIDLPACCCTLHEWHVLERKGAR
jgi:hypothetical protein